MPQSLSAVYIHLVFSTKNRIPHFRDPHLRAELHTQLAAISKNLDCAPLLINGVEDHVHILARFGRSITQADWVKELKRVSNLWLREQDPAAFGDFHWQSGYGAFSVATSGLDAVTHYITNQEAHHLKLSFQDEFREFLRLHGMEWDEQYVWD
jgi:putative transposase